MKLFKSACYLAGLTLILTAGTAMANSGLESSPRPMPRPAHLSVAAPTPCAIILTDEATGFQWYDDGTVAGQGKLPKANYASPQQAFAFIYSTAIHSMSAEGITFTPACFKR